MQEERARQDEAQKRRYEDAIATAEQKALANGDIMNATSWRDVEHSRVTRSAESAVLWSDDRNVGSWAVDAAPSDRAFSKSAFGLE